MQKLDPNNRSVRWLRAAVLPLVVAAAAGATAIPSFAASSTNAASSTPPDHIDYFFGDATATAGLSTWQFIGGTTSVDFPSATSRGVVTGTDTFGSSNGTAVSGNLGVCYELVGSGVIYFGNYEALTFTAPVGQWVTQTMSGTIIPSNVGDPPGTYQLGLCVQDTSSNLTYDPAAESTGTALVANVSGP